MRYAVAVAAQIALVAAGAGAVFAGSPLPPDGLQVDGLLETGSADELMAAIDDGTTREPTARLDDPGVEPAAPGDAGASWVEEARSAVDFPVTSRITLGVAYELEEIEDLTAELIEMGTAGVDYTSHKVLVRAQWQFDLLP